MIDPDVRETSSAVTTRTKRQFAGLWLVVFAGLAIWYGLIHAERGVAIVLGGVGIVIGVVGLIVPRAIGPLFTGLMMVTYPIGWLVSRLLLGVLFYGMFTPLGLLFRATGRDALARRARPDASSYWITKEGPNDARSYFRQS